MENQDYHITEKSIAKNKKQLLWYLILVFLLFAVIIFYYFENVKLQNEKIEINERNEKNLSELSTLKNETYAKIDTLTKEIGILEELNDSLITELNKETSVKLTPDFVVKRTKRQNDIVLIKNSEYLVSLHSYLVPKEERRKISDYLKKQGYTNIQGYTYDDEGKKPNWMSESSSVLYYSDKSKVRARRIAEEISELTGKKYLINRGTGLGVIKGQEEVTFFVHNIN